MTSMIFTIVMSISNISRFLYKLDYNMKISEFY